MRCAIMCEKRVTRLSVNGLDDQDITLIHRLGFTLAGQSPEGSVRC